MNHPEVSEADVLHVLADPGRTIRQGDGRFRVYGRVPRLANRVVRVVLEPDGETVHNAFIDSRADLPWN